jgi:membrane-associated phospholipid phosphatase
MSTHEAPNGRSDAASNVPQPDTSTESAATGLSRQLARIPLPQGNITRFLFEVVLIGVAYVAYQLVRGVVEGGRVDLAFSNASALINLERWLGIFWEPQLQGLIINNPFLVDFFNWIYIWGHLPVIGAVAIGIFLFRREAFARYRNALLISGAIGLIVFVTLPMAPPRMLAEMGFVDTITLYDQVYHALQHPAFVNQYAAMPSLHLGWNLLIGIALFESTKNVWVRGFGVLLPVSMLASIILTGNHFFLDAIAGVGVAAVALWLATLLSRRLEGTRAAVLA